MHNRETKSYKLLESAKELVFEKMPEAIVVYDKDDEAYLIFSEFGDTLIEKIDDSLFLNKAIDLLLELLKENETTIENLIVLQVFQKLYLTKDADIKFTLALKDKSIILSFYMEYRLKYLGE